MSQSDQTPESEVTTGGPYVAVEVHQEAIELLKKTHRMMTSRHPVLAATRLWMVNDIEKYLKDHGYTP